MFGKKNKDAPVFDYQDWYTPFKCYECSLFFQTVIERDNHTKHQHPTEKENTMNTYTIYTNGVIGTSVQGTSYSINEDGLYIKDGVKAIAFFKNYTHFIVERGVDKGYVDKINDLETVNKKIRGENTQLFATIERNSTTIAELRKQREDYKQKLNSVYGRNAQEVGACDKEYLMFFSGGVQGKSPCIYRHGHSGAHKTANGDVWVGSNV